MASKRSICIDYAGRKVSKILPQSKNAKLLIKDLLKQNGLKVKDIDKNGYTVFICTDKSTKKTFNLNIYFASFKFDTQRPDFVNINLGAQIDDPYLLSLNDNSSCKTLILGVYVFDKSDLAHDAIFVSCPTKKRKYSGNPSLRIRNELIQEARRVSDAIWTNNANDDFRAFQLLSLPNVININNLGTPTILSPNTTPTVNTKKSGPPPRQNSYVVSKPKKTKAAVYVARWGTTNIYKIGRAQDTVKRLNQFNQYIPDYELPNTDIWTLVFSKQFISQNKAHQAEQAILNDPKLIKHQTIGERRKCHFSLIQKTIQKHCP